MSSTLFNDAAAAAGVTEIRVHGVGGATRSKCLGKLQPVRSPVTGLPASTGSTNFRIPDGIVEAYSWGGLTSRSRSRALWIFLLPFVLAGNMAGWASQPRKGEMPDGNETEKNADGLKAGPVHGFRIAATKMAGLALTLSVLLMICLLSIDVLGYQCGAQPDCADTSWWLTPLTWGDLRLYPSRRLMVGSLVPLAVIAVFAILSFTSRARYGQIRPPKRDGKKSESGQQPEAEIEPTSQEDDKKKRKAEKKARRDAAAAAENHDSAVYLPGGLSEQRFWQGRAAHARLSRVHLSAGIAMVAVVLGLCSLHTSELTPGAAVANAPRTVGFVLAVAALVLGIALLQDDQPPRSTRTQAHHGALGTHARRPAQRLARQWRVTSGEAASQTRRAPYCAPLIRTARDRTAPNPLPALRPTSAAISSPVIAARVRPRCWWPKA